MRGLITTALLMFLVVASFATGIGIAYLLDIR